MPHNTARPLPGLWQRPAPQLGPGLYWVSQQSPKKGVVHHAVLDVGNRTGFADTGMWQDMLIHQTPPSIRREPSAGTGQWHLHLRIDDEQGAIERLKLACSSPSLRCAQEQLRALCKIYRDRCARKPSSKRRLRLRPRGRRGLSGPQLPGSTALTPCLILRSTPLPCEIVEVTSPCQNSVGPPPGAPHLIPDAQDHVETMRSGSRTPCRRLHCPCPIGASITSNRCDARNACT